MTLKLDPSIAVSFQHVDILFGEQQQEALNLLDNGENREFILKQTDVTIGVADAHFEINKAEICVLMGLSGSGKSTLLRAVNRLNKVARGAVLINDDDNVIDIVSCDAQTLKMMRSNRIAMVFQQFALLPWRTVAENVGLGLELKGMSFDQRTPIIEEKLRLVDLYQWKDKYAHELSGGMQQRVGLARAFATDADILLMDEPFSALDPLIRNHLQDFLLDLQRELSKTIIFVSHDLDEALKIGNHIAIMDGGRIVQYGEPESIVLNPANDYVAEFVAHMNPLNVLQGASFMTPLDDLQRHDQQICLEKNEFFKLELNAHFKPEKAFLNGSAIAIQNCENEMQIKKLLANNISTAPADMKMRWIIEIRQQTGCPVLLLKENRIIGVVGDNEIYTGILRQSKKLAKTNTESSQPQA